MQHSRKCSQGFLWASWQPSGTSSRTSLLPACSQPMAHWQIPTRWTGAMTIPVSWALAVLGLQLLWESFIAAGTGTVPSREQCLAGRCVLSSGKTSMFKKPISSSWGNSEVKGYFWELNCGCLESTEIQPVHAPVLCPSPYNHVVPSLGGCGQMQQLSSTPDSAGHHTALHAVRGRTSRHHLHPQHRIKLI